MISYCSTLSATLLNSLYTHTVAISLYTHSNYMIIHKQYLHHSLCPVTNELYLLYPSISIPTSSMPYYA